jgi:AraC family transcriptional regulator
MTTTELRPGAAPTYVRYLDLLARAAAHVDANLGASLDADLLARRAAMSRHHFHRIFAAYFGITVSGYVTWRRLRRACELLGSRGDPVLDIALEVGFASAQALAKAMRRELGVTPSQVRAGCAPGWQAFHARRQMAAHYAEVDTMAPLQPRWVDTPPLAVLTATGRGMTQGNMRRAAMQGFDELVPALKAAGLTPRVTQYLGIVPEPPQSLDDQGCRMLTGALFDYSLRDRSGVPAQPSLPLGGTLAWWQLPPGRCAVFTHVGPTAGLHLLWKAIYRHWLPATGYALRDIPGFDVFLDDVHTTPPQRLRTDLYLPLH